MKRNDQSFTSSAVRVPALSRLRIILFLLALVAVLFAVGPFSAFADEPQTIAGFQECKDGYFRSQLAERENGEALQYFYDQFYEHIKNLETVLYYSDQNYAISFEEAKDVYRAVCFDNGQFFWLDLNVRAGEGNVPCLQLEPRYSPEELPAAVARFEAAIADFYTGVDPSMSELELALYLHDKLADVIDYDWEGYNSGDFDNYSYKAIVEHVGVCGNYASAYQALLNRVGIRSIYVKSIKEDKHAWNLVQIDGKWYHVDVTWDDPVVTYTDHNGNEYTLEVVRKDCFGLTDTLIEEVRNHHVDRVYYSDFGFVLPTAESTEAYYKNIKSIRLGLVPFWCCYGMESLEDVTILNGVSAIGERAFEGCSALVSVTIPDTVKSMGDYAFYECSALQSVTIPGGISTVPYKAFNQCKALSTVVIRDGVKRIDAYAFANGSAMKSVTIPESVTEIANNAFLNCDRNTVFYGYANTAAQTYAVQHGYRFVDLNAACANGHAWDSGVLTAAPSCKDKGEKLLTCTRCGTTKTESVPALGHAYVKGCCSRCGYEATSASEVFVDVKAKAYFNKSVLWAIRNGVTGGTDERHFSPDGICTREQIVTFLHAAAGSPSHGMTENPFKDVKKSKYYFNPVMWAVEKGITGGVSEGKFGVGVACTREQAVVFLWKANGSPEPKQTDCSFKDVKRKQYFYKAVLWAVENGVTGGVAEKQFGVGVNCTRAQIVTFLQAVYGK